MVQHVLTVNQVDAGYGRIPILHQVSIHVAAQESVAIIGANGAGKSTLVRAICGLLPLSAGSIHINDKSIGAKPPHDRVKDGIAVVLEGRNLFGELTVRANLAIAERQGQQRQSASRFTVEAITDLFPFIKERMDAPVELLSGGEQQMVAIGRALLLQPDLLIMDEPSTGLAPKVLRHIVAAVAELRKRGLSILLIEQNVGLAAEIADRGYVMSLGRVLQEIQVGQWEAMMRDETLLRAYLGS